jgi:hypothetical protein
LRNSRDGNTGSTYAISWRYGFEGERIKASCQARNRRPRTEIREQIRRFTAIRIMNQR